MWEVGVAMHAVGVAMHEVGAAMHAVTWCRTCCAAKGEARVWGTGGRA